MLTKLINYLKGIFMNYEEQNVDQTEQAPATESTPSEAPEVQAGVEAASEQALSESAVDQAVSEAPVSIFYNGQEIIERLGNFDADGAEECKLADGSTSFVPKSVLGE